MARIPRPLRPPTLGPSNCEPGTRYIFEFGIAITAQSLGKADNEYGIDFLEGVPAGFGRNLRTGAAAMQRRSGSQSGECREKSGSARDEIALVHKTNGSYRRRGPTDTKRRGVGIGDEVLRPEESLRCARVLASPRLSIPEHLWPAPDEFGSPGSRQNNFAESGATIFHSTR
jgi:hypothetical protein